MSAGAFIRTLYETDNGDLLSCRAQQETLDANVGALNSAPTGSPTADRPAMNLRGSRKKNGVHPRSVVVYFGSSAPTGYLANQSHRIPIMKPATYAAAVKGASCTYLGSTATIINKYPEQTI